MFFTERKSIRKSTAAKSAATLQRLKERTEEGQRRRSRRARTQDEWRPTQEELLEEAKITEQENLKSLGNSFSEYNLIKIDPLFYVMYTKPTISLLYTFTEKYQKLEMEKKKTRTVKKTFQGPMIKYHSLGMPLIEVSEQNQQESPITVDEGEDDKVKLESSETTSTVTPAETATTEVSVKRY